jgi:hypothetical protein
MGSTPSQPASAKYEDAPTAKAKMLQSKRAALLNGGSVNNETLSSHATWHAIKVSWDHHKAKISPTESSLRELFSKFGEVHHVRVSRRGMAVVKFREQSSAHSAASTKMPHNFRFMTVTLKEPPQVSLTKAQGGTAGHNGGGGCTNVKLGLTFDDAREKTLFERWQGLLNDREKLSLLYHTLSNQPVMMEDMESTNQGQVS